jgi:hypothetical protein
MSASRRAFDGRIWRHDAVAALPALPRNGRPAAFFPPPAFRARALSRSERKRSNASRATGPTMAGPVGQPIVADG